MTYFVLLMIAGSAIILALAAYAGFLCAKLYSQNKAQQVQIEQAVLKRNANIKQSVDIIAFAALEKQCDFSEAAIRLFMLMDNFQGRMQVDFSLRFPAIFELYQVVENMPRGEERKKLAKKQRMQLDFIRMEAEARLEQKMSKELEDILIFTGAKTEKSL